MKQKLGLIIGGILLMGNLTGCQTKNKVEIEQSFDKVLSVYPTKNLEDFYDMEGYRDDEFDENDKGVWVLNSSMSASETEESDLHTEGMLLRMNRNTKKAKGFYYVMDIPADIKQDTKEKRYPLTYDGKTFCLLEEVADETIQKKIEDFQFFVQYGSFEKLSNYKNIKKMYNPEVPIYELDYELTNEDVNVKLLRSKYDIPIIKAPILILDGIGDLEGSSVGYKNITFRFSKKPEVEFSDSIDFQPVTAEDLVYE